MHGYVREGNINEMFDVFRIQRVPVIKLKIFVHNFTIYSNLLSDISKQYWTKC